MKIKIFTLLSIFTVIISLKALGNTLSLKEDQRSTKAYKEQADSCMRGNRVPSSSVVPLIWKKDGLEKLQALLENDCIENFGGGMGHTIPDDWARFGKTLCPKHLTFINSWICYFFMYILDWVEGVEGVEEAGVEAFVDLKRAMELRKKIKLLVNSEWFTKDMHDQIEFTELDIALLKENAQEVIAILNNMSNLQDSTPTEIAELFRFIAFSTPEIEQLVESHEHYSQHVISSSIKDLNVETIIIISGPGDKAWSYDHFNSAIDIIDELGLNWIIVGDGVRNISLADVQKLEPLIRGLTGKLMFWINGHGSIDKETGEHEITLTSPKAEKTAVLFEEIKNICGNQAIDLMLDSCYSGKACADAIKMLPEGSRFLSSASMNKVSLASKRLIIGIDFFMKSHSKFNSFFELFSLSYLYTTLSIKDNPQIFTLVSSSEPLVLSLDQESINLEYVRKNQEKIINYLKDYVDTGTLESVKDFINSVDTCPIRNYSMPQENLSRIIQYADAMTCCN